MGWGYVPERVETNLTLPVTPSGMLPFKVGQGVGLCAAFYIFDQYYLWGDCALLMSGRCVCWLAYWLRQGHDWRGCLEFVQEASA